MLTKTKTQKFKVIAVSNNTNSFGLWGHIIVNEDGKVFSIGLNHMRKRKANTIINVPLLNDQPDWAAMGAEIPQSKPDMPKNLLDEMTF